MTAPNQNSGHAADATAGSAAASTAANANEVERIAAALKQQERPNGLSAFRKLGTGKRVTGVMLPPASTIRPTEGSINLRFAARQALGYPLVSTCHSVWHRSALGRKRTLRRLTHSLMSTLSTGSFLDG